MCVWSPKLLRCGLGRQQRPHPRVRHRLRHRRRLRRHRRPQPGAKFNTNQDYFLNNQHKSVPFNVCNPSKLRYDYENCQIMK